MTSFDYMVQYLAKDAESIESYKNMLLSNSTMSASHRVKTSKE
jgi:hypothetical protein